MIARPIRLLAALAVVSLAPAAADERTFLALGDSYTIGEGVAAEERWTYALARLVRASGAPLADPRTIARTGWTCDELSAAIDRETLPERHDLVTLLVGVNDQFRGRDPEGFREDLAAMLRRAIALAGGDPGRVVVLTIPDWGVTPFAARVGRDASGVAAGIDRFNGVVRDEVSRAGARLVDVTPISRRAAGDESLLAPDGLHPSGRMYALWAEAALPEVTAALGSGR